MVPYCCWVRLFMFVGCRSFRFLSFGLIGVYDYFACVYLHDVVCLLICVTGVFALLFRWFV